MNLLAKTCACPGFVCFIANLVSSSAAYETKFVDVRLKSLAAAAV